MIEKLSESSKNKLQYLQTKGFTLEGYKKLLDDVNMKKFYPNLKEEQILELIISIETNCSLKEEFVKEDPNFDTKDPNDHQKQALPERLFKTLKFFDRTNDAEGAKNIAGQVDCTKIKKRRLFRNAR